MTMTLGQGQRSRSNFPKNGKKTKQLAISRILFHLQTSYLVPMYNPISRIQWPSANDFDLWSRSKVKVMFSQKWIKIKELVISRRLFHLQTSYLVPRYNPIRRIHWPKCRWPWPKVKVKGQGQIFLKMIKRLMNWPYPRCYFTYRLHTWYQGTTQ